MPSSFLLTKWYLDCVTESGDTAIVYVADLRWNTLSLHYGSFLTVLDGKVSSAYSLHASGTPDRSDATLSVTHLGLGVEGVWKSLRPSIRRTVFENAEGSVDWNCLQPMSHVDLVLPGGTRLVGLGYAECLTLSVLPWQLPLGSLNWGRHLSAQHALVWIDWRGSEPRQALFYNSQEFKTDSISEAEVVFGGSRLELDCGLVLRTGRLSDTVLQGISRLAGLLPVSILAVHECKWRSRGVFRTGAEESSGWTIHEVVKWKE